MAKYFQKAIWDNTKHIIEERSAPNENTVGLVPVDFVDENVKWLVIDESLDEFGSTVKTFSYDIGLKQAESDFNQKVIDISSEYSQMESEIFDELESASGTRKSDSAMADYLTMIFMKQDPSYFVDPENTLYVIRATSNFPAGTPLDTSVKIQQYADEFLSTTKYYLKFRMQRIKTFINNKVAIENG